MYGRPTRPKLRGCGVTLAWPSTMMAVDISVQRVISNESLAGRLMPALAIAVAGIWVIQTQATQVPYHGPYQEPVT